MSFSGNQAKWVNAKVHHVRVCVCVCVCVVIVSNQTCLGGTHPHPYIYDYIIHILVSSNYNSRMWKPQSDLLLRIHYCDTSKSLVGQYKLYSEPLMHVMADRRNENKLFQHLLTLTLTHYCCFSWSCWPWPRPVNVGPVLCALGFDCYANLLCTWGLHALTSLCISKPF